jgi:hypothetical protein
MVGIRDDQILGEDEPHKRTECSIRILYFFDAGNKLFDFLCPPDVFYDPDPTPITFLPCQLIEYRREAAGTRNISVSSPIIPHADHRESIQENVGITFIPVVAIAPDAPSNRLFRIPVSEALKMSIPFRVIQQAATSKNDKLGSVKNLSVLWRQTLLHENGRPILPISEGR